jgi:hypothetical protein
MAYNQTKTLQEIHDIHGLAKPSVKRLLRHILSSFFSSGTISILILGVAFLVFLAYQGIATDNYFALLIGSLTVLAFLHGCRAWQEDLNEYQKALADARHTCNQAR